MKTCKSDGTRSGLTFQIELGFWFPIIYSRVKIDDFLFPKSKRIKLSHTFFRFIDIDRYTSCQIGVYYHSLTTAPLGCRLPSSDFLRKVEMTAALVMGWAKVLSYSQAVGPDEGNHRMLFGKVPESLTEVNQAMINDPRNIQQDRRNGPRKKPEYLIALYIALTEESRWDSVAFKILDGFCHGLP